MQRNKTAVVVTSAAVAAAQQQHLWVCVCVHYHYYYHQPNHQIGVVAIQYCGLCLHTFFSLESFPFVSGGLCCVFESISMINKHLSGRRMADVTTATSLFRWYRRRKSFSEQPCTEAGTSGTRNGICWIGIVRALCLFSILWIYQNNKCNYFVLSQ